MQRDIDGAEYVEHLSNASSRFEDIQSIMFGPMSARFWIYRKHMCCQESLCESKVPFLAWQCLTIQLKNRNLDLVIKDEADMDRVLSILIYKMHTLDGYKNSSLPLENFIKSKKGANMEQVRHTLVKKTLFKFKVLRIRMKISYIAFTKRLTIPQLIMQAIYKTHTDLVKDGSIPLYDPFLEEKMATFDSFLNNNNSHGSCREIMKVNTIQVGKNGIKIDQELRQLVQMA